VNVLIWTTTPWTLPANQAVALGADIEYALVQAGDVAFVCAAGLAEAVAARGGYDAHNVLGTALGSALENNVLQHPFVDRAVPLVLGDHVTTDSGTGCVHTAPAHGVEDFAVGKQYGLPVDNPVMANGCFREDTPLVAGEFVFKANAHILEILQEKGALLALNDIEHSYPHCWRHKAPLIFRATAQWFISMEKQGLRAAAEKATSETTWIPLSGQARMQGMLNDRPDWCISRQRLWGVPLPFFVNIQTDELHPDTIPLIEKSAKLVEQGGIEAYVNATAEDLGVNSAEYTKITDTLDVWFDSGASNFSVLERQPDLHFPADLYLEGSDQHRGWFQTSLLTGLARRNEAPFKQVLTHGFVVDAKGHKMSKSLGNVMSPQDVVKNLGADILRLWTATTDYKTEMTISDDILKRAGDTYRRIRNTSRFLLSNLNGFDASTDLMAFEDMLSLDQWICVRAAEVQQELIGAYDSYQFHVVSQKLHHFCAMDLGGFYLDVIKDRQYTCQADSVARRSCQSAMYHLIHALVRLMAPILTFTAEEIWQSLQHNDGDSIFLHQWTTQLPTQLQGDLSMSEWATVMAARDASNKAIEAARAEGLLKSSLEASVTLHATGDVHQALAKLGDELRFALITSKAELIEGAGGEATELEGLGVAIAKCEAEKCGRCWHRCEDVGADDKHPTLCGRCITNVDGQGEERLYA
jgi:isoleucyl-tRNA synthetase